MLKLSNIKNSETTQSGTHNFYCDAYKDLRDSSITIFEALGLYPFYTYRNNGSNITSYFCTSTNTDLLVANGDTLNVSVYQMSGFVSNATLSLMVNDIVPVAIEYHETLYTHDVSLFKKDFIVRNRYNYVYCSNNEIADFTDGTKTQSIAHKTNGNIIFTLSTKESADKSLISRCSITNNTSTAKNMTFDVSDTTSSDVSINYY